MFSQRKNLLVIPASHYSNNADEVFNGVFAFYIDRNSIEFRSLVDHYPGTNLNDFYKYSVERSLYIENFLYTKSSCKIVITRLGSYANVGTVPLAC